MAAAGAASRCGDGRVLCRAIRGCEGAVAVGQTNNSFCPGSKIPRSDVAELLVHAAFSEKCKNVVFEVGTTGEEVSSSSYMETLFDNITSTA